MSLPDSYLLALGREYGIPQLWLEDYVQEVRIEQWRRPTPALKTQAKRTAIDFVRRFGLRTRGGQWRLNPMSLEDELPDADGRIGDLIETPDFSDVSDACLDLSKAWPVLTARQKAALLAVALGYPVIGTRQGNLGGAHKANARKKLQELCAVR